MQELLPGTWSPQILAYSQQYSGKRSQLVAIPIRDLMFRKNRTSSGGYAGAGDGGGCGD